MHPLREVRRQTQILLFRCFLSLQTLNCVGIPRKKSLGIARGISVRSTNLLRSIGAGFKSIVGGEIRNYTELCEASRKEAAHRLMQHAAEMGATAIVGMRYQSNDLQPGVVEV